MRTNNPVSQIVSILLMLGPIVLFWYIDWYWIVGFYNLYFSYTCYVLYKQYDSDSNYRKKYHFIVYVGLPLIFSFIGLLISVINGFEEIKEGDKDFNKNQSKSNDEELSIQNDSSTLNKITEHSVVSNISGFSINRTLKEVVSCFPEEYLKNDNSMRTLKIDAIVEELNQNGNYDGDEYYFHSYEGDVSLDDNLHGQISLHVLNTLFKEEFLRMEASYFFISERRFLEIEISSLKNKISHIILKDITIDNINNLNSTNFLSKEDEEFIAINKEKKHFDGDFQEFIIKKANFSSDNWWLGWKSDSFIESNKEFKSAINNIDVENLDSFSVDIIMSKWSTYEEVTYDGEFEGYGYELTGGIANKWTKHLGCYTNNLVGLLNDVGDNELYQLDSKLKYDSTNFDEEPDYIFIEKINWNEGTPKNIKEEIEENYSSNDYEKLISKTNPNETFGDIEFFNKKQSNLFQIIVKYEQGGVEKSIIWSDTEHEEGKCRDCKCDVKSHIRFCESCEAKRIKVLNKIDKTLAFLDKISPDKDDNVSSNKNKVESKNDVEPKQNINRHEARETEIKKGGLYFQDVRVLVKQLKGRKNTFKIRSLWENYCDYQLLKENSIYEQNNRGFFSKEIVSWTGGNFSHSFKNNFDPKKLVFTGDISIIEEKKIQSKEIIDSIFLYINECENPEDKFGINYDYSFNDFKDWYFFDLDDDYIGWLSDEIYIVKPSDQLNFSLEKDFNLNLDRYSDIVSFTSCETNIKSFQHTLLVNEPKNETKNLKLIKKEDDSKEEIPKNAKKINNEKDLIQELGRIHEISGHKEYEKEAYNLWRDIFLKKYDESEEKDGLEIGQEVNSVMFDMYEVDFVSFFLNNKESGDTETMDIRFPFKILENGKAALIYNFPFKYDQITSHSSGSFYQLDDVWGSLNEVCKSLSELELIDFNKLSQKEKIQLFKPNRDDYS